jgi:uncharacterized protein
MKITDKIRWLEISAVALTGILKFLLFDYLNWHFIYVTSAVLFWMIYIYSRFKRNKNITEYWGFTRKNLDKSLVITGLFSFICFILFFLFAIWRNYPLWNPHMIFSFLTYPLWGLIQQFLIMSLVAGNLKDMEHVSLKKTFIVVSVSIFFAIVHLPSLMLTIGTFFLAVFYCIVFLKYRNLYPLGIFHGWIGGLFYFYVLNRDPWAQFIEMLVP